MAQRRSENWKVVICEPCEGHGFKDHDELVDYHKREYITYRTTCDQCDGSGRMEQHTTIEYQPCQIKEVRDNTRKD